MSKSLKSLVAEAYTNARANGYFEPMIALSDIAEDMLQCDAEIEASGASADQVTEALRQVLTAH